MLDELNAQLRPHGLRFAPDISTASRATIGGMMANNSSGARSVIYGKTIDHVIEQEVVLADGSVVTFASACRGRAGPKVRRRHARGRAATAWSPILRSSMPRGNRAAVPESAAARRRLQPRRVHDPDRPFNLAKLMVGSEGTLGVVLSAKLNLVPLPKAKAVLAIQFARPARVAGRHAAHPPAPTVGRRSDGQVDPRPHAQERGARGAAAELHRRRSRRRCSASSSTATAPEDLPPRLEALERDLRDARFGYRYHHALDLGRAGADLEPSRSRRSASRWR